MRASELIATVARAAAPKPATTKLVEGDVVYMLHGCGGWARVWALDRGWTELPGPLNRTWITPGGVKVVGVIDPKRLQSVPIGAFFTFGPFAERELIVAARMRCMIGVADGALT